MRVQGKGQRKRERESSGLHAPMSMEPDTELNLMTLRSQPELKSRIRCLTVRNCQMFKYLKIILRQPWWLSGLAPPSAQGLILETWDRVPPQAPCMEPASPSACVSASLSLSLSLSVTIINKLKIKKKKDFIKKK